MRAREMMMTRLTGWRMLQESPVLSALPEKTMR